MRNLGRLIIVSWSLLALFSSETTFANLLQNPSFNSWEDDSTPSFWVVEWREKAGVFKETGTVRSQPYSARLVRRQEGTGNNKGLRQRIPVIPGTSYTLSVWFYDTHNQANGGIVMTWRDADSIAIGSTSVTYTRDTLGWQLLTKTGTAPNNPPDSIAAFVDVLLRTYGFTGSQPGGFVFVDDAHLSVTGIEEQGKRILSENRLAIYPNPTYKDCNINLSISKEERVEISIFNTDGQLIKTLLTKRLTSGSYNFRFDFSFLKSGVYFLVLKGSNSPIISQKISYIY